MNLGFYAPLKSPNHAVPSGDRAMAVALIQALRDGGHDVKLASELRIYDPKGDASVQADLRAQAEAQIARILPRATSENWQGWITYHNYYKAPDLIGPAICAALGIPYFLIEATRARKRLGGPWDDFAVAAEAACDAAHTIFYLTQRDAEALKKYTPKGQNLAHLRPFLNRTDLPPISDHSGGMLSVAMMRTRDKLPSYQLIAEALPLLQDQNWHLDIVGDGPARPDVKALFAPFEHKVQFHGALGSAPLNALYAKASLLLWPGVNEAFGMTYLEAQAAGVPVLAQNRPGVCDVTPANQPDPSEGAAGLAHALNDMRADAPALCARGHKARATIAQHHLRGAATATLNTVLSRMERLPT